MANFLFDNFFHKVFGGMGVIGPPSPSLPTGVEWVFIIVNILSFLHSYFFPWLSPLSFFIITHPLTISNYDLDRVFANLTKNVREAFNKKSSR